MPMIWNMVGTAISTVVSVTILALVVWSFRKLINRHEQASHRTQQAVKVLVVTVSSLGLVLLMWWVITTPLEEIL
jgi:ABC-type nickel/cobalt efflux system permease component RcnA